jgi:hypothetical protein
VTNPSALHTWPILCQIPPSYCNLKNPAILNAVLGLCRKQPGFDRFGNICLKLFEGFALGKTSRKSRDFSPESALFRLMDNCLKFHVATMPALEAVRNLKFATTSE